MIYSLLEYPGQFVPFFIDNYYNSCVGIITKFSRFEPIPENLKLTISEIEKSISFDIYEPLTELHTFRKQKKLIQDHYIQLRDYNTELNLIAKSETLIITHLLDKMIEELQLFDLRGANKLCNLRLRWDDQDPNPWYEKGKILYQMFVKREIDDLEGIIEVFNHVIDISKNYAPYQELTFWSYSFMANLYLYRILTGEEAMEHAFKYYNEAYRFAKENQIEVEDSFILENVEILSQILMNQYPLLILIYNNTGLKIYEYLFQFIEVITEDQRFIPNFTALLSAVDSRIEELFNSPITNSYIVIENRLMVISTLYDYPSDDWIKVAMVFSYLHQSAYDIEIDQSIMEKTKKFNRQLMQNNEIRKYIIEFNGKIEEEIYEQINEEIKSVFSTLSREN